MASKLHGSLNVVQHRGKPTLEIQVDEPKTGEDIEVTLFEVDPEQPLSEEEFPEETSNDLLVKFTVDLEDGKTFVKEADTPNVNKKKFRHGAILVKMRDDERTFEIPVAHDMGKDGGDTEFGQDDSDLELQLVLKQGSTQYKDTAAPTVLGGAARGLMATFVLGKDGNKFFTHATKFWKKRSDVLVTPGENANHLSLEEVLERLSTNGGHEGQDGFGGAFEEVNIITHGSVGTAQIQLTKKKNVIQDPLGGQRNLGKASPSHDAFSVEKFAELMDARGLDLKRIDPATTRIVIRGCLIGNDQRLVDALSTVFKGCTVHAPNYVISYETPSDGLTVERSVAQMEIFEPTTPKAVGKLSSSSLAAKFDAKYKGTRHDAGWPGSDPYEEMLDTRESNWTGKLRVYARAVDDDGLDTASPTFEWTDLVQVSGGETDAQIEQSAKDSWRQIFEDTKAGNSVDYSFGEGHPFTNEEIGDYLRYKIETSLFEFDDWDWEAGKPSVSQGFASVLLTGVRTEVRLRRMIAIDVEDPPLKSESFEELRKKTAIPRLNSHHFTESQ